MISTPRAHVVIGLGFGDEGKGITTDYLCSKNPRSIVVRFSGGQQAGHTVIIDGKKHVHSNYGSGTLRGVPSYISEHCSVYLNTMEGELKSLKDKGIDPILYVHPLARITTPYDVAFNRLSELSNGHGSCGLGVGATNKRHESTGYKIHAIDLMNTQIFRQKLSKIKGHYESLCVSSGHTLRSFASEYSKYEDIFEKIIDRKMFEIRDYRMLKNYDSIIFEGSQGIMLDMDHGIFPNVTWANTTSKNALEICRKIGTTTPEIWYVSRCYQTRHGNGWMSNESQIDLKNNGEEINVAGEWQGKFRTGEIDYDLLNYALSIDGIYAGNLKKNLVVTCLDQREGFNFDYSKLHCNFHTVLNSTSPDSKSMLAKHLSVVSLG